MLSLDKPSKTYLHMSALGFASFKALLDFNEGMDIDIGAEVTDNLKIEGRPSTNNELNEMVTSFMKEEKLGALKRGSFLTMIFEALKQPLKLFQTNSKAISEAFERPSKDDMPFGL